MKLSTSVNDPEIVTILHSGGVGVLRTDTLYGLVAIASNEQAVDRVYGLKGRDETKSPIVLVNDVHQLYDQPTDWALGYLRTVWPGKVSVILQSRLAPLWIRRSNDSVAYRLPDDRQLRDLLRSVGPLIAPSANPEGKLPAVDILEAKAYFGDRIDFYVDGGQIGEASPSRLLKITESNEVLQLR